MNVLTVKYDEDNGIYIVFRDGVRAGVVAQTILEIRLGIRLSDEEVIAIFLGAK